MAQRRAAVSGVGKQKRSTKAVACAAGMPPKKSVSVWQTVAGQEAGFMRKQFKNKIRSCALCKLHKRGWSCRWKPQERRAILETDRDCV